MRSAAFVSTSAGASAAAGRALARGWYESAFGLLLIGVMLLSTLDEAALAPLGRGLLLGSVLLLIVVNAGAAVGVYIAAALLFSVHVSAGRISWVQRPDNFALLFLTLYLVGGRWFSRQAGTFGTTALTITLLLLTTLAHLVALVGVQWFWLTWFARMFGIPLAMYVLLRRAALSPREVRALLVMVAALGIYMAVVSLLEVGGLYGLIVPPWIASPSFNPTFGDARIGGLEMQPEWNALNLSLAFCVLLLLRIQQGGRARLGWIAGSVLCLLAIYFCYTRAAYLGLLLAGVPLFWERSAKAGVTLRRRVLFLTGAVSFVMFVLFFPSQVLQSRVADTSNVFFRLNVWAAALGMLTHHPLFGVGFGQFAAHMGSYVRDLGWIPALGRYQTGTIAHNTFLSVAAELGLVGLTLYLLTIRGVFRDARNAAGAAWGQAGRTWVAGFTLVYFVNVQFITAHELTPNLLYFGTLGAVAGMRGIGGRARARAITSTSP
jgi:O-antigen ligase